jgi:hypothetical protein
MIAPGPCLRDRDLDGTLTHRRAVLNMALLKLPFSGRVYAVNGASQTSALSGPLQPATVSTLAAKIGHRHGSSPAQYLAGTRRGAATGSPRRGMVLAGADSPDEAPCRGVALQ